VLPLDPVGGDFNDDLLEFGAAAFSVSVRQKLAAGDEVFVSEC
jgi:hypothetical protein